MKKAIWSKVRLDAKDKELSALFYECVCDLLNNDMVKELDNFSQHMGTSRLQHSLNVAYYSFLLCYKLGLDYRSAARAGILHDFFLYDWREVHSSAKEHVSAHPRASLENAEKVTELNKIERDAVLRHMWPMTIVPPRYRESHIVSLADKLCTCAEVIDRYKAAYLAWQS